MFIVCYCLLLFNEVSGFFIFFPGAPRASGASGNLGASRTSEASGDSWASGDSEALGKSWIG